MIHCLLTFLLLGFVYYWSILTLTYWWFMHVSSTFWKVMYPFHARNHEDKGKYINIVCFLLGLVIPAIPPTIVLFIDGYVVNGYPPILCLPRNTDISYYGLVLPVSLSLCIGITFLVFVLHAILQVMRLHVPNDTVVLIMYLSIYLFIYLFIYRKGDFSTSGSQRVTYLVLAQQKRNS